jgi:hypothetical protein
MSEDDPRAGYGPDDMGDDEQETDVAGYEQYIADPPDDLVIAEDDDNDATEAEDWSATHPGTVAREQRAEEEPDDQPAEQAAIHQTPGR